MKMKSRKAPSAVEAQERILFAERVAASSASMEELVHAVKNIHLGCQITTVSIDKGKYLFRAVSVRELPLVKSRISYPPPQFAGLGRANEAKAPMFYAVIGDGSIDEPRSNMIACLWECKVPAGNVVAVGEWEIERQIDVYPFGFQSLKMASMERAQQPWIRDSMKQEGMQVITRWESDIFTRVVEKGEEAKYRLSIALTRYALELRTKLPNGDRYGGIVFPAVAVKLNSDNICLRPTVADTGLTLRKVVTLSAHNFRQCEKGELEDDREAVGRADITFHNKSWRCDDDGNIVWRPFGVLDTTWTGTQVRNPFI